MGRERGWGYGGWQSSSGRLSLDRCGYAGRNRSVLIFGLRASCQHGDNSQRDS